MTFRQRMKELSKLLISLQRLHDLHAPISLDSFSMRDGILTITISINAWENRGTLRGVDLLRAHSRKLRPGSQAPNP